MTLIINLATPDFVLQVADTLLTWPDGTKATDESVKSTIVHSKTAKLAVAYTGLALVDNVRTDKWLAKELTAFASWERDSAEVVAFLKERLTRALGGNPALGRFGLTVTLAGLGLDSAGRRMPRIATVTNMEEFQKGPPERFVDVVPSGRQFEHYFWTPTGDFKWFLSVHGVTSPAHESATRAFSRRIGRRLKAAKTDEAAEVLDYLVALVRLTRRDKQIGHLVGHDCTGIRIGSDFRSTSFFYTAGGKIGRVPNIVSKDFSATDITYNRS